MVATTRNVASIINNFGALSTLADYSLDSDSLLSYSSMSEATVSDNTNPFAGKSQSETKLETAFWHLSTACCAALAKFSIFSTYLRI